MHPDDRRPVESEVADAVHHGEPFEVRYRIVTADGQIRHVVDRGRLVHDEDGRTWLDGILLDITARHDAEQRLREELANRAAIEERLRISRDMHDSVSQGLFSILTHARAAELALESSEADPSALESVAQLRATAEESLDDLRTTLVELRSEMSLGEDIAAGVRHLADRMTAGRKVSVEVDVASTVPKLPSDTADAVYWVVREAVHNAVKHAEPSGVTIVLSSTDDAEFQVEIRDDGVGFDSDVASTDRLGLTTMRERLARVNGRLEVVGDPGRGTVIRAVAPTVRKPGAAAAEGAP